MTYLTDYLISKLYRIEANSTIEFLIPALLATIGVLLKKASVRGLKRRDGSVFYTGVVGQPSTGKSFSMATCQDAFDELERFFNINSDRSQQANCATVEGLIEILKDSPSIICKLLWFP